MKRWRIETVRKDISERRPLPHAGFSLLELLVVMGVISLLVSLVLPAVMQARGSANRIRCQNHLRQVSLALILNTDQNGRFPAAGLFAAIGRTEYHNWVTAILPQLGQSPLAQRYDLSHAYQKEKNFKLTRTPLEVLTCPDDVSLVRGEGNLSYVVNGGIGWTIPIDCPAAVHVDQDQVRIHPLDLNGNGTVCSIELEPGPGISDLRILEDLSLFFVENWPPESGTKRSHALRDVTDGLTHTLLLAENVRAGFDPEHPSSSWGNPDPLRSMFFVSSSVCPQGKCLKEEIDLQLANSHGQNPSSQERLNAALTQAEGTAPWPSSGHPGLVNVAWCDGRVSALSEFVDGQVYFALVTPRGSAGTGPFAESLITGTEF